MKKIIENDILRYICGIFLGLIVAALCINWFPWHGSDRFQEYSKDPQAQVYDSTHFTYIWPDIIAAPISWHIPILERSQSCGSARDDEGCLDTLDNINRGRIDIFILLSLNCGLLTLYWPSKKKLGKPTQIIVGLVTFLGLIIPPIILFRVNESATYLYNPTGYVLGFLLSSLVALLIMYLWIKIFSIFHKKYIHLKQNPLKTKLDTTLAKITIILAPYLLSIFFFLFIAILCDF